MSSRALLACTAAIALVAGCTPFKKEVPEFKEGIAKYDASQWAEAEAKFDEANRKEPSSEGHFDRGAALYRQDRFKDAADEFRRALTAQDDALKSRAHFDHGNAMAKSGQLDKAIESYRRSLELDPTDHDARYNLEWALRQKQKGDEGGGENQQQDQQAQNDGQGGGQGPQNEQQSEQKEKQASNEGKEDKDQQQKDQEQQGRSDGEKGDDGQQAQNEPGGEEPKDGADQQGQGEGEGEKEPEQQLAQAGQPQQGEPGDQQQLPKAMSRQEIGEVLDALQANEKGFQLWKFQEQEQGRKRPRSTVEKDW